MDLWSEMRTAMVVARCGTVRAAAEELGIHRATVSRHIDVLEQHLGTKLFLRHKNGYTPTKDGEALMSVAETADDLIASFVEETNVEKHGLRGVLSISAIGRVFFMFAHAFKSFQEKHPNVTLRLNAESRNANLELGEADIAIRSGWKSDDPDHVVLPLREFSLGLAGHQDYFEKYGKPRSYDELSTHKFVAVQFPDRTFDVVELFGIPEKNISVITNDPTAILESVNMGMGLGMIAHFDMEHMSDVEEILPQTKPFAVPLWIVTHVDLHRTRLVQAFVQHIRKYAETGFEYRPSLSADPKIMDQTFRRIRG